MGFLQRTKIFGLRLGLDNQEPPNTSVGTTSPIETKRLGSALLSWNREALRLKKIILRNVEKNMRKRKLDQAARPCVTVVTANSGCVFERG